MLIISPFTFNNSINTLFNFCTQLIITPVDGGRTLAPKQIIAHNKGKKKYALVANPEGIPKIEVISIPIMHNLIALIILCYLYPPFIII